MNPQRREKLHQLYNKIQQSDIKYISIIDEDNLNRNLR